MHEGVHERVCERVCKHVHSMAVHSSRINNNIVMFFNATPVSGRFLITIHENLYIEVGDIYMYHPQHIGTPSS